MKKLKTSTELKQEVQELFEKFQSTNQELYTNALQILADTKNYTGHETALEIEELLAAVNCLSNLTAKTGESVHHHLAALHDLTREEYVAIYPLTYMKSEATENLRELYALSCKLFDYNRS